MSLPPARLRVRRDVLPRAGRYVLYWMTSARRPGWSFALDHAIAEAARLKQPLLVLEALRCGHAWASARFHAFLLAGMADNAAAFAQSPVRYYPYVEPAAGAGQGLLAALAAHASLLVTDDFPCFFLPRMLEAAVAQTDVRFEVVDSNGLLPLRSTEAAFPTAYSFRRHLQKALPAQLGCFPRAAPLDGLDLPRLVELPAGVAERWPAAGAALLRGDPAALARLPIDHAVGPVPQKGGRRAGTAAAERFVSQRLARYSEQRNQPEQEGTSRLSPYLHFGHVSAHQVFTRVAEHEAWSPDHLQGPPRGQRSGYWGMSEPAEAFLDQLLTWRELGYNFCAHRPDYGRYESLPTWAQRTLDEHARDPRPHVYGLERLEAAQTHDRLWNAAMTQLKREGWFHGYLRMLWGKKILEWSQTPRHALGTMASLMDRWSLDGRDPNSYAGYAWTLGRYDRPWGPARPIFGTVRYMSSVNTARKVKVKEYLRRYSPSTSFLT